MEQLEERNRGCARNKEVQVEKGMRVGELREKREERKMVGIGEEMECG